MKTIITSSPKETATFGKVIAEELRGGEIIGLIGDLGAGKTCFVQGLAKGLKIKNIVNSPTFVIMKVYKNKQKSGLALCHIDAYRLKSVADLKAIGVLEYFKDKQTITIIEWADKIKTILPKKTQFIEFKHLDHNLRQIKIK